MKQNLKEKITELRSDGCSYREIQHKLKCSKSTISYHCGVGQKEKNNNRQLKNRLNIKTKITKKIETFSTVYSLTDQWDKNLLSFKLKIRIKIVGFNKMSGKRNSKYIKPSFTTEQLMDKIGDDPICYLTGQKINLGNTKSWHLDHIIPRSKGGENTLENANICTKQANQAKFDNNLEDFFELCKSVLEHNGYKVEKIPTS